MTTKKKCKHLCTDCVHYYTIYHTYGEDANTDSQLCKAYEKEEVSCVDEEIKTIVAHCKDYNKDGCCKKYEPLAHLKIIKMLERYLEENPRDCWMRDTVTTELIGDLLRVLNREKSKYLEEMSYGSAPDDYAIIVTKDVIKRSLSYRRKKLNYQENGDSYGESYDKLSKEDIAKEKSWLSKMKTLLSSKE